MDGIIGDGFFWRGCAIGFALAAPVGPVGMMCIRRALTRGRVHAVFTGLGAAMADTVFGAVGVFGVSSVTVWLNDHSTGVGLVGALVLIIMGLATLRADVHLETKPARALTLLKDFSTAFMLTLTNPATFVAALGAVAAFSALPTDQARLIDMEMLIAGVFAGSLGWWLFLSGVAGTFRARMTDRWLTVMNHATGGVLLVFGLVTLVAALSGNFAQV